jgi:hypothetical protein
LWKSSWKGKAPFNELCCFTGFTRSDPGAYYQEPGGALDIVPAAGYWLAFLVKIGAPLPDGVDIFIARNGTAPEGWELIANRALIGGEEGVSFTFRVYDGAAIAATRTSITMTLEDLTSGLYDAIGFRINAFFLPPTGGFPDGRITIATEGTVQSMVPLTSTYSNTSPVLNLGIGTAGLEQDLGTTGAICGIAGGEGDYEALQFAAHAEWLDLVAEVPQLVAVPETVDGFSAPGYTADNGWRGNLPYLTPGDAPDPLAPFIGATDLIETGNLSVACGSAPFWADAVA